MVIIVTLCMYFYELSILLSKEPFKILAKYQKGSH